MGQKVAFDVVELRALDEGSDLREERWDWSNFSAHRKVVTRDLYTTYYLKPLSLQVTKILTDHDQ